MNFPIYWNKKQINSLNEFIDPLIPLFRNGNQGMSISSIIGDENLKKFFTINPKVTNISCNYYSCEGKAGSMIVCCLKFSNSYDSQNSFSGQICKGIKIICSSYTCGGHLLHYLPYGRF